MLHTHKYWTLGAITVAALFASPSGFAGQLAFVPPKEMEAMTYETPPRFNFVGGLHFASNGKPIAATDFALATYAEHSHVVPAADAIELTRDGKLLKISVAHSDSMTQDWVALTVQVAQITVQIFQRYSHFDRTSTGITYKIWAPYVKDAKMRRLEFGDPRGTLQDRFVQIEPLRSNYKSMNLIFRIHGIPFHYTFEPKEWRTGEITNYPVELRIPDFFIGFSGPQAKSLESFMVDYIAYNGSSTTTHVVRSPYSTFVIDPLLNHASDPPLLLALDESRQSIIVQDPKDPDAPPLILRRYNEYDGRFLELRSGTNTLQIALTSTDMPKRAVKRFESDGFFPKYVISDLQSADDFDEGDLGDGVKINRMDSHDLRLIFDGWNLAIRTVSSTSRMELIKDIVIFSDSQVPLGNKLQFQSHISERHLSVSAITRY